MSPHSQRTHAASLYLLCSRSSRSSMYLPPHTGRDRNVCVCGCVCVCVTQRWRCMRRVHAHALKMSRLFWSWVLGLEPSSCWYTDILSCSLCAVRLSCVSLTLPYIASCYSLLHYFFDNSNLCIYIFTFVFFHSFFTLFHSLSFFLSWYLPFCPWITAIAPYQIVSFFRSFSLWSLHFSQLTSTVWITAQNPPPNQPVTSKHRITRIPPFDWLPDSHHPLHHTCVWLAALQFKSAPTLVSCRHYPPLPPDSS